MLTAWGKERFYGSVACFCLPFGTTFFVYCVLLEIGFLMGVMTNQLHYQLNYTDLFGTERVVYLQRFCFKR